MKYRANPRNGEQISQLGFGCMRFPKKGTKINQQKTNELIATAIQNGVNYFDTAYIYPGSEEALGKALVACGKREQVSIATKLPHFLCRKPEDFDKYFDTQLKRLQTDWVDYYLIHMLGDVGSWNKLKSNGIEDWINKKRAEGKIKNLGFSFHGGKLAFQELLHVFDWEFCMVQFNYLDENNQAGYSGVRDAHKKGLPVFAMEPLRGGMLVNDLPDGAIRAFTKVNRERTPVDWALRWILDRSEVTMALSGMSDMAQLNENIAVANSIMPGQLNEEEHSAYQSAVKALNKVIKVPCTGCGYCMPCPKGVDIPTCFTCYNETYSSGLFSGMMMYYQNTGMISVAQSDASKCIKCGKCEKHCPQDIKIMKELVKVRRRMKTFFVKPITGLARKFLKIK